MPSVSQGLFRWLCRRSATLEDFADRLNHVWTVGLLLLLACIVSWRHTYNDPISCWTPAQFTEHMTKHTDNLCWHKNPANMVPDELLGLKLSNQSLRQGYIPVRNYSLWLPLMLCFQALLFKLPNIILYVFHGYSGVSFDKISGLSSGYENLNLQERQILGRQIARYVLRWCRLCGNCLPWRLLTLLWFLVKVLYLVNVSVQLSAMTSLMTPHAWPLLTRSSIWRESLAFPRRTRCDFEIFTFGRVHKYEVECFMSSNVFNQSVIMFVMIWLLIIAIVTGWSLAVWFLTTLIPLGRKRYLRQFLESSEDPSLHFCSPADLDKFSNIIGEDGVMVLKLTSANSSELLVQDVVCNMWGQCLGSAGGTSGVVLGPGPSAPTQLAETVT